MTPELEGRIYAKVLRRVMWGEQREEIFDVMRANDISDEDAERMFQRARGERIALLRSEAIRKAVKGAVMLVGGVVLFAVFWLGFGVITRSILVISSLLAALGVWRLATGTVEILMAGTKKGSVAPD